MQHICTLKKLCFSNNNIGNEAAHDIAAAISCNIHLQELNIGNNDFTPPGALTIARSLLKILTLTKLYFHGNCINDNKKCLYNKPITNKAINDFAIAISCNTDLQELNLGSTGLQTSDAIKIARGLQKISSLTKLYINHNNITDEAADDIAAVISCNIHLQELNLGSNTLQTSGTIKIARSSQKISSLTKLYINHNNITHEAADDIATAISCNIDLQELNLCSNNLQTSGTIKIARSLQNISSLTKLYINHNNITYEAAYDIAAAISSNTKLQEFDVSGNNLQTTGAIKIVKALKDISTLRKLYISNNNITDEVADDFAKAISCNTQMELLDISGNNLQAMGGMKIVENLWHICTPKTLFIGNNKIAADDVAAVISGNSCLQELYICRNDLQTTSSIIQALQDISTLTNLLFNNNDISNEAVSDIAVVISRNTKLKAIEISFSKLKATDAIKIMKALQGIHTLQRLYLNNNNIIKEAAGYIATAISCNIDLQELNLGSNNLQTSGTIKIAKHLQNISSLTKLYINHNNITYEAAYDIAAAISSNTKLQEFDISGNYLQTTGAIKIVKALKDISTLRKFYISNNNITDEVADDFAKAISCNTQMELHDISGNNLQAMGGMKIVENLWHICTPKTLFIDNNKIAADDVAAVISGNSCLQELYICRNDLQTTSSIIQALQDISTLTNLLFNNNDISNEAVSDIAVVISRNTKLKAIEISFSKLKATDAIKVMKALQGIHTLQRLYLNNNNITKEAAGYIATAISCNIDLQELNLGSNNLQTSGTIEIARSLQKISSLTKLYINNNNITHEAADDIAAAISCNIDLQELNLGSNTLQTSGTIKIARSLQKISSLTKLYINHNNITHEASDDIAAAIFCNVHLQELILGSNNLQTSGTIKIAKHLQNISSLTKLYINHNNITYEAAYDIAAAISSNTKLQEFDVSGNNLQTTGAIKIVKALKDISTLRKLYISNNNITDEVADDFAKAISCNTQMELLDISGNNLQAMGGMKIVENLWHICTPKTLFIDNNKIAADDVAAVISGNSCLQELYICRNDLQTTSSIIQALQDISTLTNLLFNNNDISNEAVSDIAVVISRNTKLKAIEISFSKLKATDAIKIMKALQGIHTLQRLYLNNNNITKEAAGYIATAISCNIDLQELNLGSNNLQTSGTIEIARSLQKISSLTKLYINNNNISHEAADDIAAAILCNVHLQELNLDRNNIQGSGTIKIARSLQKISSLTKLHIKQNNITDDAADDIGIALCCNRNLQKVDIGNNCFNRGTAMRISSFAVHLKTGINFFIS